MLKCGITGANGVLGRRIRKELPYQFYVYKDKIENYKKVKNINSPILIMHGEKDQLVPFSMGKKIYEIANKPKYSYFTKYDNHMMEYDENLIKTLNSFLINLN